MRHTRSSAGIYALAGGLGVAFSIFLLAFAWQNALETARRQFAFESVSIGNTLGQNVTSADEVSEYLASLLADPRGEARAAFPALAKSALSQHLFLNAVGYESIAELSSIKDPGADKAATKQRTQTSVSSTPTNEGTDSHAFLMQLPREPQLTTADLLAVINHPEILSTVFSAAGAIPTGVATSGPLAGKYLLVRAVREAGTHSSVVPRSDPLGVLLMVIDPSMLLGPTARQENLSISLISESEGVVGRQFLFNEANRSADSEDGWVITRLTESTSVQLPASSFRLLIGKPVHWRSIEHGLIYTALFLGGGITLLLVALARARELQARELRERNFEIERQVLRQTRELAVARDEALSASRVKSDFLASMSHEIRTPLNAIIGMSELLGETSLNDEQSRYVGVFRKAGEALLSLVNDILDLSKIEAKQLTLESIELNLRELVENAVDLYVLKAGEKGLSLSSRVAVALPNRLLGDPTRLRQVLLNLIGNAIKFTERGGIAVRVTAGAAHSSRRRLHFSVEDTGIGIPENKLESIFSSFTQVDSSTTRKYGGTGLGLAISKHLVQMMGGNLSVNSQLGVGSTFSFDIELEEPTGLDVEPRSAQHATEGAVMLIASDKLETRVLAETIEDLGWQLHWVNSPMDAVRLFSNTTVPKIQTVIFDHDCDMAGQAELVSSMQANHAGLRVVMLTQTATPRTDLMSGVDGLAIARIVKPVKMSDLQTALSGSEPSTPVPMQLTPKEAVSARRRLLLVDDTPDNVLLIQAFLKSAPYDIDTAENGAVAVEMFAGGHYDLVLMDMQMPVMDGYAATSAIREFEQQRHMNPTTIIALTAHAIREDVERCIAAGCTSHLAKPIKKAVLLDALGRLD